MKKHNLVLVPSFPTNSHILVDLIGYLDEFFHVHFIDLPGFEASIAPLNEITFSKYSKFVKSRLDDLNLDQYIIGGISLGFHIANKIKHNEKCLAIFALEPYLGPQSLIIKNKRFLYTFVRTVAFLGVDKILWRRSIIRKLSSLKKSIIDQVYDNMDRRTYLKVAGLIINNKDKYRLQNRPYLVFMNPRDTTLDFNFIKAKFETESKCHLIVHTTLKHFPKVLTKKYFESKLKKEDMRAMIRWVEAVNG